MNHDALELLALEALYDRRSNPTPSCLHVNIAARELAEQESSAMQVIENLIVTQVYPNYNEFLRGAFLGVASLLGAYMLLGAKHDVARCVGFLRSLPPELLGRAVVMVPIYFRKTKNVRIREAPFNEQKTPADTLLLELIKDCCSSDNEELRQSAEWASPFFL